MGKRIGDENRGPFMSNQTLLYGIAPVQQCLLHSQRKCHELLVKENLSSARIKEIAQLAQQRKIPLKQVNAHTLSNLVKTKLNQGIVLRCGELRTWELGEFLAEIPLKGNRLLLALDQVEDPQNVGAIIRSAAFLGADAIISLKKHAAPLSAAVSKASAGALESFPVIQAVNLSEALQKLKKEGFTIAGATSGEDSVCFTDLPLTDSMVLVLGNEGQGLRKLTRQRCDFLIHIPGNTAVESLNVSAAAAILIQHMAGKQI